MEVSTVSLHSLCEYIISKGVIVRCEWGGGASGAATSGGKIGDKMIIIKKINFMWSTIFYSAKYEGNSLNNRDLWFVSGVAFVISRPRRPQKKKKN